MPARRCSSSSKAYPRGPQVARQILIKGAFMRQIPGGATLRGRQWWIGLLAAFAVSGVINSSGVTSLSGVTGVSRVTGLHGMTSLSVITGWGGILNWADSCGSRGSCGYDAASGHHPTGVYGVPRWFGRTAVGGEIGFVEDFALAPDRAAALKQLVPGTDDYYYYHALQLLNTQQFDKRASCSGHGWNATTARRVGWKSRPGWPC